VHLTQTARQNITAGNVFTEVYQARVAGQRRVNALRGLFEAQGWTRGQHRQ